VSWPGKAPQHVGGRNLHGLGDVRANRVGWIRERLFSDYSRLRAELRDRHGHTSVLLRSQICGSEPGSCMGGSELYGRGPIFDGAVTYVMFDAGAGTDTELFRSELVGGQRCITTWSSDEGGTRGIPTGDVAVANGRIYYADGRGVFAVDPTRVHFSHRQCT
jgi:hypothetical protein